MVNLIYQVYYTTMYTKYVYETAALHVVSVSRSSEETDRIVGRMSHSCAAAPGARDQRNASAWHFM